MSNLSQLTLEYQSISLSNAKDEEEEGRLQLQKHKVRQRLIQNLQDDTFECLNGECPFESDDLNTFLNHEIKCYDLKTTTDKIIEDMESMNVYRYALNGESCKYCGKCFKTKNLLSQHQNRGVKLGCVKSALNKKLQELTSTDRLLVLNFIREKICKDSI